MTRDAAAMAPELSLFLGGLATLVGGSFTPRTRQWRVRALAALAALACAAFAVVGLAGDSRSVFEGAYAVDDVTGTARILVAAGLLAVLALSGSEIAAHPRESEICTMLLLGGTGVLLMAGTRTSPSSSWRSCSPASRSTASSASWSSAPPPPPPRPPRRP